MATNIFNKMEIQVDGELTMDQFISACLMDEDIVLLLRSNQETEQDETKQD